MPRAEPDLKAVYAKLKAIMKKFERGGLTGKPDKPGDYALVGPPTPHSMGKDVWFGAVQTRKRYVSYHLMAVYMFPELLQGMSPELRKRMQGKSCFNFRQVLGDVFRRE